MSLFDSASLVVTPNGYKEDKLYSIKPTDGSGDLVVTRATTATRVNSEGLIEQVPYNLFTYSEDFSNVSWIKSNATITSNSTTAPNGTLTADTILANSAAVNAAYKVISTEGIMTLSVYAKANTSNFIYIEMFDITPPVDYVAIFDLSNGTYIGNGGFGSVDSYNIESVGNGWFKISITKNLGTGLQNHNYIIGVAKAGNSIIPVSNTSVYIWGAQLVSGTSAKEYFPTTDRLDVPRLDYTNSTCPSILVEGQRTNLVTYSEQFDNGAWYKDNVSISANSVTSPSGIQNADSILETATTSTHTTYNRASMTSGQAYTQSCYFKANGRNRVIMQIFDNATQYANAIFDLSSGVVVAANGTATIQNMTNGWYRCTITGTSPATGLGYCVVGLCENTYSTPSVFPTYLGDITKGVYSWGFQIEQGSYPTSYIPTVASTVTRNADVISKTGISSLIGQTEGTIFMDFIAQQTTGLNQSHIWIGSIGNEIGVYGGVQLIFYSSGGVSINAGNYTTGQRYKIAFAYKNNDYVVYINGVLKGVDTSASVPTTSNLSINSYFDGSEIQKKQINSAVLWKTRLSNTELATLTTI